MQIPQRSVVPCSGLTSWVYGANHAGITAVVPMGGRHPQWAASFSLIMIITISLLKNTVSIRVETDGKLFFSLLRFYRGASCCKTPLAAIFFFLPPHWTRFKAQWQKMDFLSKINKYFISTNVSRCKITASPLVSFGITFPLQSDSLKSIFSPGGG